MYRIILISTFFTLQLTSIVIAMDESKLSCFDTGSYAASIFRTNLKAGKEGYEEFLSQKTKEVMQNLEVESWIIRPSSIADNLIDKIFTKTITIKKEDKIINFRIIQTKNNSFCILSTEDQRRLKNLHDFYQKNFDMKCLPSFDEVVMSLVKSSRIELDLSKLIVVTEV